MYTEEREITKQVKLCDISGNLNPEATGWSRFPLHVCNLSGHWPRKKKWNYWNITTDRFSFSSTIANVDYIGLNSFYFLDYEKNEIIERVAPTPLGTCVQVGPLVTSNAFADSFGLKTQYIHDGNVMTMKVDNKGQGGIDLKCDLRITSPDGHETLSVVVPWGHKRFQYTSKQNTLPVKGIIEINGRVFDLSEEENAYACLDFGRGIWPYAVKWNWGSASGKQGDHVIGLNFGGKWTDNTGSTENGICIDGKLYKNGEDIDWEYDTDNFMAPWRIKSRKSDMFDLTMTPFYDKHSKLNLGAIRTEVHQCFGVYEGEINIDGKKYEISGLKGWAEEHIGLW
ncbi:MAG TPA: DUF2804 domain-containing protein [bacterium]|nr:DUF2804 domain-containing protein [bacterium]